MKTIHKYTLTPGENTIELPLSAKILDVRNQRGNLCMWALLDTSDEKQYRRFNVYMTGEPLPHDPGEYVGTVLYEVAGIVVHVFEVK